MRIGVTDRLPDATLLMSRLLILHKKRLLAKLWNVYRCSIFDNLVSTFASVAIKSGGGNLATLHRRTAKLLIIYGNCSK